jgi:hypothetical protein
MKAGSRFGPYEVISWIGASSPRHLVPLLRPARRTAIAAGLNFHLDQFLGFGSLAHRTSLSHVCGCTSWQQIGWDRL